MNHKPDHVQESEQKNFSLHEELPTSIKKSLNFKKVEICNDAFMA